MKAQWSSAEIAAAIGVSLRRFHELRTTGAPLPPPTARLGNALLWDAAVVRGALPQLRAWRAANCRRKGRRP